MVLVSSVGCCCWRVGVCLVFLGLMSILLFVSWVVSFGIEFGVDALGVFVL